MKTKICFYILLAAFGAVSTVQAGTKEELIRLQNEVKIIQRQFQEFSESYNEHLGAVHSLVIQLNDEIARTNSTLSRMGVTQQSDRGRQGSGNVPAGGDPRTLGKNRQCRYRDYSACAAV